MNYYCAECYPEKIFCADPKCDIRVGDMIFLANGTALHSDCYIRRGEYTPEDLRPEKLPCLKCEKQTRYGSFYPEEWLVELNSTRRFDL